MTEILTVLTLEMSLIQTVVEVPVRRVKTITIMVRRLSSDITLPCKTWSSRNLKDEKH